MFRYITIRRGVMTVHSVPERLTLDQMQAAVGGGLIERFQAVPVSRTLALDCYCNEEGKIRHLPVNVYWPAGQDMIRGDILIVGGDPTTGETVSLPDDAAERVILADTGLRMREETIAVTGPDGTPPDARPLYALLVEGGGAPNTVDAGGVARG